MEVLKNNSRKTTTVVITNIVKGYNCTFCINISDEVWSDINNNISCCRCCWNNNPIVARAIMGKSFIPNNII
jgi:hypothetical protein